MAGDCEIVEAKNEKKHCVHGSKMLRTENRSNLRPPLSRKVHNKTVEDDIHKLFEAVNLRTCKSLDLSDPGRNSKKPMRAMGSHSPVIGFSEPVSIKQVLRGMCVSQAAEMAAVKRSLMGSSSPRISEAGEKTKCPEAEESGSGSHSLPEESALCISDSKPATQSEEENPALCENKMKPMDVKQLREMNCSADERHKSFRSLPNDEFCDSNAPKKDKKISNSKGLTGSLVQISAPPPKVAKMAAPKARRKPKLQPITSSSAVKASRDMKSGRNATIPIKPVTGNKSIVVKKSKKVVDLKSEQLFCQNCQCSLRITPEDSTKNVVSGTIADSSNKGTLNYGRSSDHLVSDKPNFVLKNAEKGDNSYSSKSSNCDFSSSTPSLSEESSPSGSTYGNRPHMSKDLKWKSIECIRKQYGFLGLNRFNLLKKLGSGDIGTVYLAELIGTSSLFAIKVMDNEFLAKRQKMARAQTEGEILRMLDHPFLPTLYAQFTSDNLSCLVMEFCPGGDLHVLRQKQPDRRFSEHEARFYVAEVLLALEYLHMLGIVYRDLKPENILVREDGHIMLTDFDLSLRCSVNPTLLKSASFRMEPPRVSGPCTGSSCIDPFCAGPSCKVSCFTPRLFSGRKMKPNTAEPRSRSLPQLVVEPTEARSNSFVGTHEYLAPEIIKGEGHGSSVDWWTFGILLFELLYGKTPFKGTGNEDTLANVVLLNLKFPDTPFVSFQARDLIRSLLVKEPERRLGTETGATEIKRHPLFEGLNWALIRCAVPPQTHETSGMGNTQVKGKRFGKCSVQEEHLEFELF